MFNVETIGSNVQNITLVKTDTLRIPLKIYDSDLLLYTPVPGDQIYFTMKSSYKDKTPAIEKQIPYDAQYFELLPRDTVSLKAPSTWLYQICIIFQNGDQDTFLSGELYLKPSLRN